ncbi:MAG: fibrobacter succinogenes major paralogous domain-containing protein [Paludibacter sp.]
MRLKNLFFLSVMSFFLLSCNNENLSKGELINVLLNPSFITITADTDVPMRIKSNENASEQVIYAIQIYENDVPYYYGLFDDISKMQIALTTSNTYRFKLAAFKVGTGLGLKQEVATEGKYFYLPTKTLLENKFIKGDVLKDINSASSIKLNNSTVKDYPEIDAFFCDKTLNVEKGLANIDFSLLRMGFGITYKVDGLTNGKLFVSIGNDTSLLTSSATTYTAIRGYNVSSSDFVNIFNNANTNADSILVKAKWVADNGTVLNIQGKFKFTRNYQKTINIQLNTTNSNLNFEDWNTVTDVDGNVYKTVRIGNQTWMGENLKVTHYRNGETIPNVTSNTSWGGLTTGAWSDYSNITSNGSIYGHLYNWFAATDSRNIAPSGWHVPTDAEWNTLEKYLTANGFNYDGTTIGNKIAKSLASTIYWGSVNIVGNVANDVTKNNKSGFNGFPSGWRYWSNGLSYALGSGAVWWSSTNNANQE